VRRRERREIAGFIVCFERDQCSLLARKLFFSLSLSLATRLLSHPSSFPSYGFILMESQEQAKAIIDYYKEVRLTVLRWRRSYWSGNEGHPHTHSHLSPLSLRSTSAVVCALLTACISVSAHFSQGSGHSLTVRGRGVNIRSARRREPATGMFGVSSAQRCSFSGVEARHWTTERCKQPHWPLSYSTFALGPAPHPTLFSQVAITVCLRDPTLTQDSSPGRRHSGRDWKRNIGGKQNGFMHSSVPGESASARHTSRIACFSPA
jgi:hypothetical protein